MIMYCLDIAPIGDDVSLWARTLLSSELQSFAVCSIRFFVLLNFGRKKKATLKHVLCITD